MSLLGLRSCSSVAAFDVRDDLARQKRGRNAPPALPCLAFLDVASRRVPESGCRTNSVEGRAMRRLLLAAAIGSLAAGAAAAQSYPSRPLTMIVPFPAGGATDTLARFLAERMRASLGQPVVIENVAGAAGSIGVGRAVRAPADGYTLSIG